MTRLLDETILPAFSNPVLDILDDQARLTVSGPGQIAFTTDSYVVSPLFFPGGDIGELAVNGTINDLAVGGAQPLGLSLAFILEEGFPMEDLRRVVESTRRAALRVGVPVVTGDTKVVERGSGDGVFINTSGIGWIPPGRELSANKIRVGDVILLSGTIGDHGVAVLTQREELLVQGEVRSDTAPLLDLIGCMLAAAPGVHAMRDPTRGGLAATLVEIARRQRLGIALQEEAVPVAGDVRGACELLGLDPLFVANEGKCVAFVAEDHADAALEAMRAHSLGRNAARIGRVVAEHPGMVIADTLVGGHRIIDLPYAEQLPRIC